MLKKVIRHFLIVLTLIILSAPAFAEDPKPSNKDKCPVCGMFVYKYTDWIVRMEMKDGSRFWFDGPKDAFRYYFGLKGGAKDVKTLVVTDYYGLTSIDGFKAFYVLGSDVMGPMGRELVPLKNKEEAEDFMRDHKGRKILMFDEITSDIARDIDR